MSSRRVGGRMSSWRQELHVVRMKETPIFLTEGNTIPVSAEHVLSEVFFRITGIF